MATVPLIFLLLSTIPSNLVLSFNSNEDDLISVVVLFRHGDRAPIFKYQTDPYDESHWPFGLGQLTNIGKSQQYALGQWFRDRYSDFLPSRYNVADFKIISSNVDRCLMSASANLAGLYPPQGEQIWNARLKWHPIPIHTQPEQEDPILAQGKSCPKYRKLFEDFVESDTVQALMEKNKDLFGYLSEKTGEDITTIEDACYLHDTLKIEKLYNFSMPNWTDDVFPPLTELCNWAWTTYSYNADLARLEAGPLINLIVSHFEDVTEEVAGTPRFLMLSAHDSTIASLLTPLQVFDMQYPEYASSVIFELRKGSNTFVNLFYKNSTDFSALILPDCDLNCPLDAVRKIVEPIRIGMDDWNTECQDV